MSTIKKFREHPFDGAFIAMWSVVMLAVLLLGIWQSITIEGAQWYDYLLFAFAVPVLMGTIATMAGLMFSLKE